jgi:hypothetical protein
MISLPETQSCEGRWWCHCWSWRLHSRPLAHLVDACVEALGVVLGAAHQEAAACMTTRNNQNTAALLDCLHKSLDEHMDARANEPLSLRPSHKNVMHTSARPGQSRGIDTSASEVAIRTAEKFSPSTSSRLDSTEPISDMATTS